LKNYLNLNKIINYKNRYNNKIKNLKLKYMTNFKIKFKKLNKKINFFIIQASQFLNNHNIVAEKLYNRKIKYFK